MNKGKEYSVWAAGGIGSSKRRKAIKAAAEPKRYFIIHGRYRYWYLVDASKREEWFLWSTLPETGPEPSKTPEFAKILGCDTSFLEFENPIETKS